MATITFDTLKFVRTLKNAGVPESEAEAFSEAFKEAQGEAELATQHDISDVRRDIDDLWRDMDARFIQIEQRPIIKLDALMALSLGIVAVLYSATVTARSIYFERSHFRFSDALFCPIAALRKQLHSLLCACFCALLSNKIALS